MRKVVWLARALIIALAVALVLVGFLVAFAVILESYCESD